MYTYLLIDLITTSFPLLIPRLLRRPDLRLPWWTVITVMLVAIPKIIWDIAFTHSGVWGFNGEYLIGFRFINLPIEEVLFFIAIPFACLLIYLSVRALNIKVFSENQSRALLFFIAIAAITIALTNFDKAYTSLCGIVTFLLILMVLVKPSNWIAPFLVSFIISLVPFFIVNGILTSGISAISSQPVVWYNNTENLGIRIGSIPVEDIFYSLILLLTNTWLYESVKSKLTPSE